MSLSAFNSLFVRLKSITRQFIVRLLDQLLVNSAGCGDLACVPRGTVWVYLGFIRLEIHLSLKITNFALFCFVSLNNWIYCQSQVENQLHI